jgi:hypothetical protein
MNASSSQLLKGVPCRVTENSTREKGGMFPSTLLRVVEEAGE